MGHSGSNRTVMFGVLANRVCDTAEAQSVLSQNVEPEDRPTVSATQSTRELLAALSQASLIHIREGRRPVPHGRFNEAYMMHLGDARHGFEGLADVDLPTHRIAPRKAYEALVRGEVGLVPFEEMSGRTLAVGLQPYPPGIPILLPGEDERTLNCPFLSYLRMLQEWDAAFPGFEHDVEGSECVEGRYAAYCVRP